MASRRMFSDKIVESDAFIDLPIPSQALYFHLCMQADDDGFIGSANKIIRMIGVTKKDFDELVKKRFIIVFESGVCLIKHWKISNVIQRDRYNKTVYTEELQSVYIKDNKAYTECIQNDSKMYTECIQNDSMFPKCIQNVSNLDTQVSIGKVSIGKVSQDKSSISIKNSHFVPPSVKDVFDYCQEQNYSIDAEIFINHYESVGWVVGKSKMKNWKAAVRNWEHRNKVVFSKTETVPKKPIKQEVEEDRFACLPAEFVEYLHRINAIDGQTLDYGDLTKEDVEILNKYGV